RDLGGRRRSRSRRPPSARLTTTVRVPRYRPEATHASSGNAILPLRFAGGCRVASGQGAPVTNFGGLDLP
ncbi:MAG TPA: hypothetical protein VIK30_00560, partial [Polyangia bacterium]